jgi:hypothetical protein
MIGIQIELESEPMTWDVAWNEMECRHVVQNSQEARSDGWRRAKDA